MRTAASKWAAALALLPVREWFAERGVNIQDATVYSIASPEAAARMQFELGIPFVPDELSDEIPVMGFDSIVVMFESGIKMIDMDKLLCGYVYSRKAGRCAVIFYEEGALHMYGVYDANKLVGGSFWSYDAFGAYFVGLLRLIQECETTRVIPTFSDRHATKKFKRMGIRALPFLRLRAPRYRGERKQPGSAGTKLTHRHRRCGHERMHVQYLRADDSRAAKALKAKGYTLYSRATLSGEVIAKLADRARRIPEADEVVAVRLRWIDECLVGSEELPLHSTLRVVT